MNIRTVERLQYESGPRTRDNRRETGRNENIALISIPIQLAIPILRRKSNPPKSQIPTLPSPLPLPPTQKLPLRIAQRASIPISPSPTPLCIPLRIPIISVSLRIPMSMRITTCTKPKTQLITHTQMIQNTTAHEPSERVPALGRACVAACACVSCSWSSCS